MLGSVGYSLMVQYYYGYGDSFTYYIGGTFFVDQIQADFSNLKYMITSATELQRIYSLAEGETGGVNGYIATESSVAVMKASAIISILSFNKFLITSLIMGLYSFAGQWKLFQVFNDINKGKNKKILAFAVLYTPAIWFWGSGLMKESICMGSMGFIISILYNAIVKKRVEPLKWVLLLVFTYITYVIKSYIITILIASLLLMILFTFFQKIKFIILRGVLTIVTLIVISFSISLSNFSEQISDLTEESLTQIENYQKNYQAAQQDDENSKAGFEMASLNPSLSSMILRSPVVVLSCLFRPFLWESKKIIILFSSLESTFLLLSTLFLLFKTKFFGFFKLVFTNHYVFFCFIISILFATIIGFTTFNFGSMTRYKIVLLPFYYFMLVQIYTAYKAKLAEQ